MEQQKLREIAWIGDAVLALWARNWILGQIDIKADQRTDVFVSMTSNRFLKSIAEPTSVEARIGEIYKNEGLDAAFEWMNAELLPLYRKQMRNASKGRLGAKKK